MGRALLVDDESLIRRRVRPVLEALDLEVVEADDGKVAIERLRDGAFEVVVTDLRMPEVDGMAVIREVRALSPETPVIVLTASGRVEDCIAVMKAGASDFITKPFHADELRDVVQEAISARAERITRPPPRRDRRTPVTLIGDSPAMRSLLSMVERVGSSDATVLVTGESGTGKEVIARLLHGTSPRAGRPFVAVNCGAIPEGLVESELFGHARGSFTGAMERRIGRFAQADGGTLFLDEVGELSAAVQVKLLRVLQEREVTPVGDARPVTVDVRVIAATHRDLESLVAEGGFREDLYYRLAVVPIEVPPLRARADDIPALTHWFLDAANARNRCEVTFSDETMAVLRGYAFPGNVRELENLVERLVVTDEDGVITVDDLPNKVRSMRPAAAVLLGGGPDVEVISDAGVDMNSILRETENRLIDEALKKSGGNKARAAQLLGINRTTLVEKLKRRGHVD
ncbi:MAG: sigma-54-dependent Fis family transcriptional regulator [Kofleriaceae bacterium]|nr:sigma-54-dependent Fis family transcriptional regulator [Myxococcales bacterium]MCB9564555.1 sigma-54-dependent Fis family transcriptional regulator [Kofleriaceae bacterium]